MDLCTALFLQRCVELLMLKKSAEQWVQCCAGKSYCPPNDNYVVFGGYCPFWYLSLAVTGTSFKMRENMHNAITLLLVAKSRQDNKFTINSTASSLTSWKKYLPCNTISVLLPSHMQLQVPHCLEPLVKSCNQAWALGRGCCTCKESKSRRCVDSFNATNTGRGGPTSGTQNNCYF